MSLALQPQVCAPRHQLPAPRQCLYDLSHPGTEVQSELFLVERLQVVSVLCLPLATLLSSLEGGGPVFPSPAVSWEGCSPAPPPAPLGWGFGTRHKTEHLCLEGLQPVFVPLSNSLSIFLKMPEGLYFIFKINGNLHILHFGCLSAHPCPFTSIPGPRLVLQSLGAWVTVPGQMLQESLSHL